MTSSIASQARFVPALMALCAAFPLAASAGQRLLFASPTVTNDTGRSCDSVLTACSLLKAQDTARTLATTMNGNIVVNLIGGVYRLTETFRLDTRDSGRNGFDMIYQSIPNDPNGPPIFSGGIDVDPADWWYEPDRQLWGANLTHSTSLLPLRFRQIYVNGRRAIRARYPNANGANPYLTAVSSKPQLTVNTSDLPPLASMDGVEVTWLAHWRHLRTRVQSMTQSGTSAAFTFKAPEQNDSELYAVTQGNDTSRPTAYTPYFLENHLDFVDAPDEWYLDQSTGVPVLYFKPRVGEEPPHSKIVIPYLDTLMSIDGGTSSTPAVRIQVKGITFRHSNWTSPDDYGYFSAQAALELHTHNWERIPGALRVANAQFVRIEGNTFTQTGAHGILMIGNLFRTEIEGNVFTDLSAGGISAHWEGQNAESVIANNLVDGPGQYYQDAVGINMATPRKARVEFNEVRNAPYTGISIGWKWNRDATNFNDNLIRFNDIHDVMQLLDDGAGIYTLGNMTNTRFQDNYIRRIVPSSLHGQYPIAGIYLDNGSWGKTVDRNLIDGTGFDGFYAQAGAVATNQGDTTTGNNDFIRNRFNVQRGTIHHEGTAPESNRFPASQNYQNLGGVLNDAESVLIAKAAGRISNQAPSRIKVVASSALSGSADLAVDNLIDDRGWLANPSVLPWWHVDLGSLSRIKRIQIVGQAGPHNNDPTILANRSNFEVWAAESEQAWNSGNRVRLARFTNGSSSADEGTGFPGQSVWTYVVPNDAPKNQPFQYIGILKTKQESFYLSEVRIFR